MILELWHRLYFLSVFKINVEHVFVTLGLFFQLSGDCVVHFLAFFGLAEQILYPTEANVSHFFLAIARNVMIERINSLSLILKLGKKRLFVVV